MKCPFCGAQDTKVIDSRPADDNSSIRRRRQCEECGKRFTTYEKLETLPLMIIKKDDSREPYNRAKIENGILLSCHKRPVSSDQITKMIDEMRDTDFDVCWEHGVHPSPAFLRASVDAGEAYVGLVDAGADGAGEDRAPLIASAMVLNGEGDAGYEHAPWRVTAEPDEVLVVHVLGTLPAYHGRGFARAMVEACIDVARAASKKAVRLDTFTTNVRAQNLYESCGFVNCGIYEGFYDFLGLSAVMYEHAL